MGSVKEMQAIVQAERNSTAYAASYAPSASTPIARRTPPCPDVNAMADEEANVGVAVPSLKEAMGAKHPLGYSLMRWLLSV